MNQSSKRGGIGALGGIVAVLLVGLLVLIIIAYTGSYNVAASEDHGEFTRWFLETTMHNSVSSHAADINAPERFTEQSVVLGAREYAAMCEHCHGAPGKRKASWAEGMLPQPPHLPDAVPEWEVNEVFWLVKHGVKMSGMPSFGLDHEDETLWNITAFVMQLPAMTEEEYNRLTASSSGAGG